MIEWQDFVLKKENAKELKIDDLKEPSERNYIYLRCCMCFGGVCNIEEIDQITDIVYQAYLRKKYKEELL